MRFLKRGLIFCPSSRFGFDVNTFMVPTPLFLGDRIRVFGSVRDQDGVGRLMKIDLNPDNPSEIIDNSYEMVLGRGDNGCFDDNGVVMGSLVATQSVWRLYYVGFQRGTRAKFFAFTGVAESRDLVSFTRVSSTPIIDRKPWMRFIGAVHSVVYEGGVFRVWYVAGDGWQEIGGQVYPKYCVYYTESPDGLKFDFKVNKKIVIPEGSEYRIGRPVVYKVSDRYVMFCSSDSLEKKYKICFLQSTNGIDWERDDDAMSGLEPSGVEGEWDSRETCYPALVTVGEKTYAFYNGNGMGLTGFGYAEVLM